MFRLSLKPVVIDEKYRLLKQNTENTEKAKKRFGFVKSVHSENIVITFLNFVK